MKPGMVLLVLFFVGVTSLMTSVKASAVASLPWSLMPPTVLQNIPVTTNSGMLCRGYLQAMTIAELHASYTVCADGNERLKIGYFTSGGPYQGAVEFPYSNEGHVLEGVCQGIVCRYSAETDVLVTLRPVGQYAWGAVVYKHASERIRRFQSGGVTKYVFDSEHPDYAIKNNIGRYLSTPSFGLSNNGQWLVVELRDSGLAVINTDSFSELQIATAGYRYGYGLDPNEQLAVSDDGKSVALMGSNAGFRVIDVVPGCGQGLMSDLQRLPSTVECPSTDLGIGLLFPNFHSAEQPRFFGNGQQLEVIFNSWVDGSRRVIFLKNGASAVHKLKLLSLGDSFMSGEGETDTHYYQPGTNDLFDTCHVSSRSYPFLIAQRTAVAGKDVKSVACSGAKVKDIIGTSDLYWGQASRLGATGLKLSPADKAVAQEAALGSFQPGRALQSSFLERYNPEAITIGVGGNDAGLMGKLKACAMPGTCEWAQAMNLPATAGEIRRLYGTLGSLFAYTTKHNPDARVYVVGYPNIIDAEGTCDVVTGFLLDHTERIFLNKSIEYLNQVIRAAAHHAGFTYLDIEHSLNGKNLCSGFNSAAMNGLKLGSDISIISSLPMLKVISSGTFHPTPFGHSLIAETILAGHTGLRQDTTCAVDPIACMVPTPSIEAPSYWGAQTTTGRLSYATDFALPVGADAHRVAFTMPSGTFEPGSSAEMSIQSQPLSLGTFTVDATGGVAGDVMIPLELEDGFHTLHLVGANREANVIDLYQFVTIGQKGEILSSGGGEGDSAVPTTANTPPSRAAPQPKGVPATASVAPSATPSAMAPSLVADAAVVLGVQDISAHEPSQQSVIADPVHRMKEIIRSHKVVVVAAAGLGVLIVVVICVLMIRRVWAKSGS